MPFRLLDAFEAIFRNGPYLHRRSNLGDALASLLYEDLHAIGRSTKLSERIAARTRVVNARNVRRGVRARRGDGSFGELIPNSEARVAPGLDVARGEIATVEIGVEVKILAKAMIKQIDRVAGDLENQVRHFQRGGERPICVGIVGVNHASAYTSHEGARTYPTDGGAHFRHPIQEAAEAERRLQRDVARLFDEFLVLRFAATNVAPYEFEWVDGLGTRYDYAAILTRLCRKYDDRF